MLEIYLEGARPAESEECWKTPKLLKSITPSSAHYRTVVGTKDDYNDGDIPRSDPFEYHSCHVTFVSHSSFSFYVQLGYDVFRVRSIHYSLAGHLASDLEIHFVDQERRSFFPDSLSASQNPE